MDINLLNYGLAFVEGFALILSPCILPILPIILSGSLTGGKRRPIGIIIGFTLFFALFSLLSGLLIRHIGIDLDLIRKISYSLIIIFGIILVSDYLSDLFSRWTQGLADKSANYADKNNNSGFLSGILFGGLVSIIWVPCGGPILAAAIVNMAVQKTFLASFITFLFFAFGSVLPMMLIALIGKKIISKTSFLKQHSHMLRKIFGIIIIISALIAGFFGTSVAWISNHTKTEATTTKQLSSNDIIGGLASPYPAPALNSNTTWLNSPPLTIQQLKGKVVLVDFWTYSCINCIRTLPYLRDWYNKYHDQGLVIIGVHAPEFEFEKNVDNVKLAIKQYGIKYPVVLDNNYVIWQNFNNQYWPAHYLIDKEGNVVYQHFGEGNYAETEHNIRVLLGLSGTTTSTPVKSSTSNFAQTPETYLGSARAEGYAGTPNLVFNQASTYRFPTSLPLNSWALQGQWMIKAQDIQAVDKNTAVKIRFFASHVYVVMGSKNNLPINVKVLLNGKPVDKNAGTAVRQSSLVVSTHNLYSVISFPHPTIGELELQFDQPGVELYTFTFG
ncbi:MAG: cytochrome c biogenesis protein DipZ [Gammaproteobacteria bacterium]